MTDNAAQREIQAKKIVLKKFIKYEHKPVDDDDDVVVVVVGPKKLIWEPIC